MDGRRGAHGSSLTAQEHPEDKAALGKARVCTGTMDPEHLQTCAGPGEVPTNRPLPLLRSSEADGDPGICKWILNYSSTCTRVSSGGMPCITHYEPSFCPS